MWVQGRCLISESFMQFTTHHGVKKKLRHKIQAVLGGQEMAEEAGNQKKLYCDTGEGMTGQNNER